MKKRIEIRAFIDGGTINFRRVRLEKIEAVCGECGQKTVPAKPFGNVFIPISAGVPDEILISLKKEEQKE